MTTQFFLHAASSTVSGTLPSTKQTTQSITLTGGDAVTVNRSMDTTIGTSQTSIQSGSTRSLTTVIGYLTRFVSLPLSTTSISANTWTFAGGRTGAGSGTFYMGGSAGQVPAALFVWRPSTGTNIATIFDTTASNASTAAASATEKSTIATFTGSGVTAAVGDVLIYEQLGGLSTSGTARTGSFYYDGVTATTTDNTTVTSMASNLSTPQTLTFASGGITATTTPVTIRNKYITIH